MKKYVGTVFKTESRLLLLCLDFVVFILSKICYFLNYFVQGSQFYIFLYILNKFYNSWSNHHFRRYSRLGKRKTRPNPTQPLCSKSFHPEDPHHTVISVC